ncbi:MAG: metallophosphoesterase [Planctomycetota bacterium]
MNWLFVMLIPIAMIGHAILWISFWNRLQATGAPQWIIDALEGIAFAMFAMIPVIIGWALLYPVAESLKVFGSVYLSAAALLGVGMTTKAMLRRTARRTSAIRKQRAVVESYDALREQSLDVAGWKSRWLFRFPGNQSFELEINEKEIELPRLDDRLDGLSIAHLSDLHFSGRIVRGFFEEAIEHVNEMDADIVAITGDLVDYREYLSWIPPTLGRLRARHGVYVILGNHDCKQNLTQMRFLLNESGLISLSGRLHQIDVNGVRVVLAGNELPWIAPTSDMSGCPTRDEVSQLRILLSHSPDQIEWARHFDFDLMLSGHTHGGQFRIPGIGPFICPSRLPLEYASGVLFDPPTVLHVTRGLSGLVPLRLNCRPELTRLVLRSPVTVKPEEQVVTSVALPNDIETKFKNDNDGSFLNSRTVVSGAAWRSTYVENEANPQSFDDLLVMDQA